MTNLNEIEQVLNAVGIQLRDSIDSFRNVDDVLDEVAENWKTYSDVQKSGIATAIARTRQRENFLVLMENWNQVAKYEQISANSYGTAIEKMEAYTSGVEAAQKRLTASMEKLALWFNNFGALEAIYNTAATLVDNMAIFSAALLASAIALDKGMAFTLLGNGVGKLTSILGNVGAMFSGIGNLGADKNYFKNLLGLNFAEGSATSLSVVREMYSSALGRATVALTADEKAIYDNIQSTLLSTNADTRKTLASHMLTNSLTENDISLLENTQLEQLLTATTGETVDARKTRLAAEADYTQALRREATNLLNNSGKAQGTVQVMRKNLDDSTTRTGASLAVSGLGNIFGVLAGGWSGGAIGNFIGGASGQTIGMMLNGIFGGKAAGNLIGGLASLKGYRNKKNNIAFEADRIFDTTYEDVFAQKQQELREYASLLIGDTGAFIDEDSIISQAQDAAFNAAEQAAITFTQSSKQNLKGSILGAFGGPIGLASIGLQIGMAVWSAYLKAQDEALKKAQEKFKEANDKYAEALNTSIKTEKYDKLAQGVDYLGRNISLTDNEYQEFLQISNELAEAFPELIVRTDSFGNKLVGPNGLQGQVGAVTEEVNDLVSALKQDVDVSIFEKAFGYFIQFGDFKFGKVQGKSVFEQQKEDIKSQIDEARKERFNDATDEGIQNWINEQFELYQGYENQVNNLSRQGYGDEDKIYQNAVEKRDKAKQDYDDLIQKQKEYQSAIKAGQAELNGYIPSIIAYATTTQGALDGLGEFAGLQNRLSELNTDEKSFVDAITQLSTVHIAIDDNYEENVLDTIDKITKIVEDNPIVADLYYGIDDINILDFDKYSIEAKETVKKVVSQIKDENVKQDIIKAIGFSGGIGGVIGDLANPLKEIQDSYSNKIADYEKFIELVNNGQYSVKDIQIIYELLSDSVEDVVYNVGTLNDILFDTKYKNSSVASLAEEWDRLNKLQKQGEINSNQEATMEAIAEILTVMAKALGWENEELDKLIPKLKMVQGIRPNGETTQTKQEMEDQIKTYENYYKYMRDDYKGTWDTENLTAMSSDVKIKDKLAQFISGDIGQSTFTAFLKELSDASKQQYKFKVAMDLADTESGYQALLKGNKEVIDKMQKQYGIDAKNFATFSALKEFISNGIFKGILSDADDWVTEMAKRYDKDAGNFTRRMAIKNAAKYLGEQDNVDYEALWEQSGKQTSLKRFTEQYHNNLVREKAQEDYNTILEILEPLTANAVTAIGDDTSKKAEELWEAYESALVKEFAENQVRLKIGVDASVDDYGKAMGAEYYSEMRKALNNEIKIYESKANTTTEEGLQYTQKLREAQVKLNNLDDEEIQDKIELLKLQGANLDVITNMQKELVGTADTEKEYYEYVKQAYEARKAEIDLIEKERELLNKDYLLSTRGGGTIADYYKGMAESIAKQIKETQKEIKNAKANALSQEEILDLKIKVQNLFVEADNLDDEIIEDTLSFLQNIEASQSAIVKQYQQLLTTADSDQERLEYEQELNKAILDRMKLEKELFEFEKKIMDYEMEYFKGLPESKNYTNQLDKMIKNLESQVSKSKEILQKAYNNAYQGVVRGYQNAIDAEGNRLYSDSAIQKLINNGTIDEEAQQSSDYQDAMTNYIEAQQALGDLYIEDFNNKINAIERRIKELETSKANEWASDWSKEEGKVIKSATEKMKEYYSKLDGYYQQEAKAAMDTLTKYADVITDEQIEELVSKYNDAMKIIRDNSIQLHEDIKNYQESVYGALINEVGRYKDQLEEQKRLVEEYYDEELEKLGDKQQSIQRTNQLIELQNQLLSAQKEKERVYREGVGWVYESPRNKIKDANKALDDFTLQDQINDLQNAKDAELKALNDMIQNWDDYLKMLETRYNEFDRLQEQKLLKELLGVETEEEIQAAIKADMLDFTNYMKEHTDDFFTDQINAFSNFNTTFGEFLNEYKANLQTLYDLNTKGVETKTADEYLPLNDKFLDTQTPDYTGEKLLGGNTKKQIKYTPEDLYDIVKNDTKLIGKSIDEKYRDSMTGDFVDYSQVMLDQLIAGDYSQFAFAAALRDEKQKENEDVYGAAITKSSLEKLAQWLENDDIDKEKYEKAVSILSGSYYSNALMVESAINSMNQQRVQEAIKQGEDNAQLMQIESTSGQLITALVADIPLEFAQNAEQELQHLLQASEDIGSYIDKNGLSVNDTLHTEMGDMTSALGDKLVSITDIVSKLYDISKEEAEKYVQSAVSKTTGSGSSGGGTAWNITVNSDGSSNTGHSSDDGYYSGATSNYKSQGSGVYSVGSQGGKDFINNAPAGSTMTGGDGSTWTKNSDGSTTITKNGKTYSGDSIKTYASGIENGPVTKTGYAMLHGSPTSPEYVLNTDQAGNVLKYIGTHENASDSLMNMVSSLQQDTLTSSGLIKHCFEKIFGNIDDLNVVSTPYIGLSGLDSNQFEVTHNKWEDEYLRNMATARMPQVVSNNTISNDTYYEINGDIVLENCDNPAEFWDKVTAQMGNRWNVTKRTK